MKHILELPWGDKAEEMKEKFSLKMIKGGYSIYSGVLLPRELRPYVSEDFSYPRWLEDESNAHVSVPESLKPSLKTTVTQQETAEQILAAYEQGDSGMMVNGSNGSGKKLSVLAGITEIAKSVGYQPWDDGANKGKLLIVTEKSFIPSWRLALKKYPAVTALTRPMVIDYNQLNKLLMAPPSARIVAKKSTKDRITSRSGKPTVDWDYIIFDQSISLQRHSKKAIVLSANAVAKLNKPYHQGKSPFVVFSDSRNSINPLEYSLMSKILGKFLGATDDVNPEHWGEFLLSQGFSMRLNTYGYSWLGTHKPKGSMVPIITSTGADDLLRMREAVSQAVDAKACLPQNEIAVKDFIAHPVSLSGGQKSEYSRAWATLRKVLNRNLMGSNNAEVRKCITQYNRSVNELKIEHIISLVTELVNAGDRVVVQLSTIQEVKYLADRLAEKKIPASATVDSFGDPTNDAAVSDFIDGETSVLVVGVDILGRDFILDNLSSIDDAVGVVANAEGIQHFLSTVRLLFSNRQLPAYVLYIEKTVEEPIIELFSETVSETDGRMVTPLQIEKILRNAGARTTKPNRMS